MSKTTLLSLYPLMMMMMMMVMMKTISMATATVRDSQDTGNIACDDNSANSDILFSYDNNCLCFLHVCANTEHNGHNDDNDKKVL